MCLWKCPESALQIPTVIYFFPNIGLKTSPWLSQSSWSHQKKEKGHDNNISIWLIFLFKCSFHHIHVFCPTRSVILRLILYLVWIWASKGQSEMCAHWSFPITIVRAQSSSFFVSASACFISLSGIHHVPLASCSKTENNNKNFFLFFCWKDPDIAVSCETMPGPSKHGSGCSQSAIGWITGPPVE
jgi:hypothetical protein